MKILTYQARRGSLQIILVITEWDYTSMRITLRYFRLSIIGSHCVLYLPRSTLRSYSLPPLRLVRSRILQHQGSLGSSSSQCFRGRLTLRPLAACGHCLVPVRQDPCVTSKGRKPLRFM